jgi:hypothetical protein
MKIPHQEIAQALAATDLLAENVLTMLEPRGELPWEFLASLLYSSIAAENHG